jgi:CO dehydrogenase/acetyl-CoA synthase delta subunit
MGWLDTPAGRIARIATRTGFADTLGGWKARWGIGRMDYIVPPGLYAIGTPAPDDPVVVTANYKMSYDIVRCSLAGRNAWLLVLETYGINVWCAAGKGTFGTGELVRRVASTGLARVVSHRRLLLPILGAPGVAAHQVAARCGFSVSYAAIRAADLPAYLDNGMVTTPAMRQLTFTLYERLVLIPVEVVLALRSLAIAAGVVLLACWALGGRTVGLTAFAAYGGAVLTGIVVGPLLLPWLPGRSFAVKGVAAGLAWAACIRLLTASAGWSVAATIAALLALPAVSAFYTLNFTGCTPYTSRSGVKKEMRLGLPAMGGAIALGLLVLLAGLFL